jgi:hypothetical protein
MRYANKASSEIGGGGYQKRSVVATVKDRATFLAPIWGRHRTFVAYFFFLAL